MWQTTQARTALAVPNLVTMGHVLISGVEVFVSDFQTSTLDLTPAMGPFKDHYTT
jgi:hypothetical protein